MKTSPINKVFLTLELIPVLMLLVLSFIFFLISDFTPHKLVLLLSTLSLVALSNIIQHTLSSNAQSIKKWAIYLSYLGLLITAMGLLVLLIDGNGFKSHSPNFPYSGFSAGVIVVLPYLHVMLVNGFFLDKKL